MPLQHKRDLVCDISVAELAELNNKLAPTNQMSEEEILSLREKLLRKVATVREQRALESWITADPKMLKVKEKIIKIASRKEPVLITGPTGVGKGMLARAISIPGRPFITATCGGFPRELIPSFFFGCLRGAYTGAIIDRKGYLVAAGNGTVFLDEIGDLPLESQATLLHAIQEQEVYPVGATDSTSIDCRFVAATNYNLKERIHKGLFREDLFARLSIFHIEITGLSERPGDIELIARELGYEGPLPFPENVLARIATQNVRAIQAAIIRYETYGEFE